MSSLSDVTLAATIPDGYVLTWDATNSYWNAELTGSLNNVVEDLSPQLGGDLDLNGYSIVTAAVATGSKGQNITLTPNGAGTVVISGNATGGAGQIKLNCDTNTHGIIFKGPPHSAAANYTFILPTTMGSTGQVLTTNGTSVTSWSTITPAGIGAATAAQGTTADSAMQVNTANTIPAFGDDSLAAAGGVVIGGLYRIGNAVQVRIA